MSDNLDLAIINVSDIKITKNENINSAKETISDSNLTFDTIQEELEDTHFENEDELLDELQTLIMKRVLLKLSNNNIFLNVENISTIMMYCMIVIENISNETNNLNPNPNPLLKTERKNTAKIVVRQIIRESNLSPDNKTKLLYNSLLTDNILDDIIEVIIKASKGDFEINKELTDEVIGCCFSFLSRLRKRKQPKHKTKTHNNKSDSV